MKKLLLFPLLGLFALLSHAQYVENGGFETWRSSFYFEYPQDWSTSSFELAFDTIDAINASKTTGSEAGKSAIKLDIIEYDNDTLFGYAMCAGEFHGDNMEYIGGFPMSGTPDTLFVQYTCDVEVGDTALIFISFKKDGVVLGETFLPVLGTKTTWDAVGFELPVLGDTPDTGFIAMAGGNMENGLPGSSLTVDSLWFGGTSDVIPNSGFSEWLNFGYEEPEGWVSLDALTFFTDTAVSVTRTDDVVSGDYAVRIESVNNSFLGIVGAALSTGEDVFDQESQYFDVDFYPTHLTGFYKYIPVGSDSAGLMLLFRESDDDEIRDFHALHAESFYTAFDIPISIPDTFDLTQMIIAFTPSYANMNNNDGELGSVLYLDQLELFNPCDTLTPPDITQTVAPTCELNQATLDAGAGWDSYLWSTTETTQSIVADESITYTVTVVNDEIRCEFTDDFDVSLIICDAIEELNTDKPVIMIYPNPSNGIFSIKLDTNEETEIEIVNIAGARVYSKVCQNTDIISVNLSSLPKGIYYINARYGETEITQKLILH